MEFTINATVKDLLSLKFGVQSSLDLKNSISNESIMEILYNEIINTEPDKIIDVLDYLTGYTTLSHISSNIIANSEDYTFINTLFSLHYNILKEYEYGIDYIIDNIKTFNYKEMALIGNLKTPRVNGWIVNNTDFYTCTVYNAILGDIIEIPEIEHIYMSGQSPEKNRADHLLFRLLPLVGEAEVINNTVINLFNIISTNKDKIPLSMLDTSLRNTINYCNLNVTKIMNNFKLITDYMLNKLIDENEKKILIKDISRINKLFMNHLI